MDMERCRRSCDTFVVLPPLTDADFHLFGKNSDRPGNEVQEVIFVSNDQKTNHDEQVTCTYITIPQVKTTYRCILSKPAWCWGAEMGANEHGVCIGNEAVWSYIDYEQRRNALTGLDIVRLALERSQNSRTAVEIIGELVETYGQGGSCYDPSLNTPSGYDNSFMIVDREQAWTIETCDRVWVAKQIKEGFYNMSNVYSIGDDYDLKSKNLERFAQEKNLWDGTGKLNFTRTFQDPSAYGDNRLRAGRDLLEKLTKNKTFSIFDMISILRHDQSNICMIDSMSCMTTGSQVSVLTRNDKMSPVDGCHFFTGTPNPKQSLFKPFIFSDRVDLGRLTVSTSKEANRNQIHPLYGVHQKASSTRLEDPRLRDFEVEGITEIITKMKTAGSNSSDTYDSLFYDAASAEIELIREIPSKKTS